MEISKKEIINKIINKDKKYKKQPFQYKINIIIFNNNLSLNKLIYLDDISRILSINNDTEITCINLSNKTNNKEELNKYRINYNKYIELEQLEENSLDILNILNNQLIINNNCLYLDNLKLVDELGNYTESLYKLNYLNTESNNHDYLIIYDEKIEEYKSLLNKLNLKNITNINIIENININLIKDIDKTRLDAISSNIDLNKLKKIYQQLDKLLYNQKSIELDIYNELDNNIEYNILELLNNYNKIINKVLSDFNLIYLIEYINKLINLTEEYIIDKDLNLSQERINFITSIKTILNKSLDLLGVIPIYI